MCLGGITMQHDYRGVTTALVTPRNTDYSVDRTRFASLVESQLEAGIDGLLFFGTTGEAGYVDFSEQLDIVDEFRHVLDASDRYVPIIAGTGVTTPEETITRSLRARDAGADAVLVVNPPYVKANQDGIRYFFDAVAAGVEGTPIILYNVPSRTGMNIEPETVIELAGIDNVIGIKEACGNSNAAIYQGHITGDFVVLSGDDASAIDLVGSGGYGLVSVASNIAPHLIGKMIRAGLARDFETAYTLDGFLQPLFEATMLAGNPMLTKYIMERLENEVGPAARSLGTVDVVKAEVIDGLMDRVKRDLSG